MDSLLEALLTAAGIFDGRCLGVAAVNRLLKFETMIHRIFFQLKARIFSQDRCCDGKQLGYIETKF